MNICLTWRLCQEGGCLWPAIEMTCMISYENAINMMLFMFSQIQLFLSFQNNIKEEYIKFVDDLLSNCKSPIEKWYIRPHILLVALPRVNSINRMYCCCQLCRSNWKAVQPQNVNTPMQKGRFMHNLYVPSNNTHDTVCLCCLVKPGSTVIKWNINTPNGIESGAVIALV